MKSIIAGALATGLVAVCLSVNVQAKTLSPVLKNVSTTAVSDTGKMSKMAKGKMDKMSKMENKKADKMDKMSKSKMDKMDKMGKKKMSKDTASKM